MKTIEPHQDTDQERCNASYDVFLYDKIEAMTFRDVMIKQIIACNFGISLDDLNEND